MVVVNSHYCYENTRIVVGSQRVKIETGYYDELLKPETMTFHGNTKSKVTNDKNSENMPHLEITAVVLIHCNIVNNDHQQGSRVLCIFIPNKSFGQLLHISKNFKNLKFRVFIH